MADRYVPEVGDRIVVTVTGTVKGYTCGNKVLVVQLDSGREKFVWYDADALFPEAGLDVEKVVVDA